MKNIYILTILIFFSQKIVFCQETDNIVAIIVSGSGKTQDEAKQSAFRSAIEQAFGVFISTKTEILNDQIISDQISSIASGNIQSFFILNESQLPDGSWGLTLKAIVSLNKLTSFIESKGIAIEIKGDLFALNIKQQILNESAEVKAVSEMVGLLHETLQSSFDFNIKSGNLKSLDADNLNWEIPLVVTVTTNKNIDFCTNYFLKTLTALSLSSEELTNYKSLNKKVFSVEVNYFLNKLVTKTFYLRKHRSLNALKLLIRNWEYYTRNFIVQSGINDSIVFSKGDIFDYSKNFWNTNNDGSIIINFLNEGKQAAIFNFQDRLTLKQIEKLNLYTVKPRGDLSQIKHGGFVIYEKDGHGLVASTEIGRLDWDSAIINVKSFESYGYNDWYIPSKEELKILYENLIKFGVGGFANHFNFTPYYWSSSENDKNYAWVLDFSNGHQKFLKKESSLLILPIRRF